MAVLPMKRITVYGLKKDRKAVLEAIQRMGTVEIRDAGDDLNKVDTASFQATFFQKLSDKNRLKRCEIFLAEKNILLL